MSEIRVECHAGHRADERPLRFILRGRPFEVDELDGRWYSPDASYFRVRADDGNYYVLRHDEAQDLWTLDGFRATRDAEKGVGRMVKGQVEKEQMGAEQKSGVRKELRKHQRLLVPEGRKISAEAASLKLNGTVRVIGLGGMFIRTRRLLHHGRSFLLELKDTFISFSAECTVRNVNENGIGVEITQISPENEQKLKMLLLHLKP
jgi:hypothetical protein